MTNNVQSYHNTFLKESIADHDGSHKMLPHTSQRLYWLSTKGKKNLNKKIKRILGSFAAKSWSELEKMDLAFFTGNKAKSENSKG